MANYEVVVNIEGPEGADVRFLLAHILRSGKSAVGESLCRVRERLNSDSLEFDPEDVAKATKDLEFLESLASLKVSVGMPAGPSLSL